MRASRRASDSVSSAAHIDAAQLPTGGTTEAGGSSPATQCPPQGVPLRLKRGIHSGNVHCSAPVGPAPPRVAVSGPVEETSGACHHVGTNCSKVCWHVDSTPAQTSEKAQTLHAKKGSERHTLFWARDLERFCLGRLAVRCALATEDDMLLPRRRCNRHTHLPSCRRGRCPFCCSPATRPSCRCSVDGTHKEQPVGKAWCGLPSPPFCGTTLGLHAGTGP